MNIDYNLILPLIIISVGFIIMFVGFNMFAHKKDAPNKGPISILVTILGITILCVGLLSMNKFYNEVNNHNKHINVDKKINVNRDNRVQK